MAAPDIHSILLEYGHNGELWLPHDAMARSLQTGRSLLEQFVGFGYRPKVVPKLSVQDGIQAVRQIITNSGTKWSKSGCSEGLEALKQYQRIYNDKAGVFSQAPKHDWASHYADAKRYAALAIKPPKVAPRPVAVIKPPPMKMLSDGVKLDEIWDTQPRHDLYGRL
jgi:phage terminase large subunit